MRRKNGRKEQREKSREERKMREKDIVFILLVIELDVIYLLNSIF